MIVLQEAPDMSDIKMQDVINSVSLIPAYMGLATVAALRRVFPGAPHSPTSPSHVLAATDEAQALGEVVQLATFPAAASETQLALCLLAHADPIASEVPRAHFTQQPSASCLCASRLSRP